MQRPKIVLASASIQRKKILKLIGLKFSAKSSRVREKTRLKGPCARLVRQNAFRKAQDVASRLKKGLVIGADTLVYTAQKEIIGKPRTLSEAKAVLKKLQQAPHWVYTGLAIVDARTKRFITDFEKTKIFMDKISDREIRRYHSRIFPLNKAGGFDVQGRGALFIRRFEGCYFNVVGLPIAKLYKMLKKFGVGLLTLLAVTVAGCATEYNLATEQQETLLYGTEKEVKIGESIAAQFDEEYKILNDFEIQNRVNNVLRRIVQVCDRQELVYTIKVVDDEEIVNAVSLPGGFVYVYKGLIDKVKNDDQLACVIAHEVGHITARHAIKKLQSFYGYTFLRVLAAGTGAGGNVVQGIDAAFATMFTEYSQEDELEADRLAIKYAKKAGFSAEGMAGFLRVMKDLQEKEEPRQIAYWKTHPNLSQRIAAANKTVTGQLEFKDYLNLIGE